MLRPPINQFLRNRCHSQFMQKLIQWIAGVFAAFILTGCATQLAYREGKALVAQEKFGEGMSKLYLAMTTEPQNAEYRVAYLQARDRAIQVYLEQAQQYAAAGRFDDAENFYRKVFSVDAKNDRARMGLQSVEMNRRHKILIEEAVDAINKNDLDLGRSKLLTVISENPGNSQARQLRYEIDERSVRSNQENVLSSAFKKPISIEFKDAQLKQIFEVIALSSGLNILFDRDVKTDLKTSIYLKNSTIDSALNFLMVTNQLEQKVLDQNTILIYPNTQQKSKDYQEQLIKSFFLANADAKTVANTLKSILKTRDVIIDEKLNMLIMRDSIDSVRLAERLVALHDVPEPEVMLEVEVLEIKRSRLMELGIKWPDTLTLTPLPSTSGGQLTLRDLRNNINSGSLAAGISPLAINAKKQDSDTNLLANPRIRARNHEKAKILIGERVPNITSTATSTGFLSESINYVDVGLKLDVEPTIYLDNDVAIKVSLEVSNIVSQIQTKAGSIAYQIGTRTASTVLRLKDGENQVLAGLINDEERTSASKIPAIGELPIVGRLFGSTADEGQKTEIVLSITPRLIRNIRRPDFANAEFRSGTESNYRARFDVTNIKGEAAAPSSISTSNQNTPKTNPPTKSPTSSLLPPSPIGINNAALGESGALPSGPAAKAQLLWQGPTQVKLGENFNIQIKIQADQPIKNIPLTLGFDEKTVQVIGVSEGDFLKQGGAQSSLISKMDSNGKIVITAVRNSETGATALGTLASVTFKSLSSTNDSVIQILSAAPVGLNNEAIPILLPSPLQLKFERP